MIAASASTALSPVPHVPLPARPPVAAPERPVNARMISALRRIVFR